MIKSELFFDIRNLRSFYDKGFDSNIMPLTRHDFAQSFTTGIFMNRIERRIACWVETAIGQTDTWSGPCTYSPVINSDVFYHQKPNLKEKRDKLLAEHSPCNAITFIIDMQTAFGARPYSQPAQNLLQERSCGIQEIQDTASFVNFALNNSWVVFTVLQHGEETTRKRIKQQARLGLLDSDGNFLLCTEGSYDNMSHPLLLRGLGLNDYEIIRFESNLLRNSLFPGFYGLTLPLPWHEHLPVLGKPDRDLDKLGLIEILTVQPSDIFLVGVDAHCCVKDLAVMFRKIPTREGKKPNIWLIEELIATRPSEFDEARAEIEKLITYSDNVFLIEKRQALQLLEKNRIIPTPGYNFFGPFDHDKHQSLYQAVSDNMW